MKCSKCNTDLSLSRGTTAHRKGVDGQPRFRCVCRGCHIVGPFGKDAKEAEALFPQAAKAETPAKGGK